jgi:hypothetical protein
LFFVPAAPVARRTKKQREENLDHWAEPQAISVADLGLLGIILHLWPGMLKACLSRQMPAELCTM